MIRPSIDQTMMDIAKLWARRSTCQHLNVGAVLAFESRVIATGFNGAPPGMEHCRHDMEVTYLRCTNTNHAEANVLAFAARNGTSTEDTTLYTTHSPCKVCAGLLIAAGITRVVYGDVYQTQGLGVEGLAWLQDAGIEVDKF
jgi:dCMP deaminase